MASGKEAIIVDAKGPAVGFVYDRVDDPGDSAQYGIQRLPWDAFRRTHNLKLANPVPVGDAVHQVG